MTSCVFALAPAPAPAPAIRRISRKYDESFVYSSLRIFSKAPVLISRKIIGRSVGRSVT
jgi:hypothetical protein